MELTGIDKTNRDYFAPILFGKNDDKASSHIIEAGVMEGGVPCAAASIDLDWKEKKATLTSVYTLEKDRKRGAGKMALNALIKAANGLKMNTITVYGSTGMPGLYEFLHSMGFELFPDGDEEIYDVSDILSSERVKRYLTREFNKLSASFGELNEAQLNDVKRKLGPFPFASIDEFTDNKLSHAIIEEYINNQTKAAILTSREEDKVVASVDLVASFSTDLMDIAALFVKFFKSISESNDVKTIAFLPVNPKISGFLGGMAYHTKGQSVYHGILRLR